MPDNISAAIPQDILDSPEAKEFGKSLILDSIQQVILDEFHENEVNAVTDEINEAEDVIAMLESKIPNFFDKLAAKFEALLKKRVQL